MKIQMDECYRFCGEQDKLQRHARRMKDGRKAPHILAGTIFLLMVWMVAWGQRHFLPMDQWARRPAVRRVLGWRWRARVCSDSTIERSLPGCEVGPVRALLGDLYQRQPIQALPVRVGAQRLRCGAIDGSQLGHFEVSGLMILGRQGDRWLDVDPIPKTGQARPTSQRLLTRPVRRFGRGFLARWLLDGLDVAPGFIRAWLNAQIDVAIKTDDDELLMIQHANQMVDHHRFFRGVEYVTGVDPDRTGTSQVWACGGFTHTGVPVPLTIARVCADSPQQHNQERFYGVCTRAGLSALELPEVGH